MAMAMVQEWLLNSVLIGTLSLAAGAAIMIVHGLLMYLRLRSSQSLGECVTQGAVYMGAGAAAFTLLLLTQASSVPWDWLGTLALLVATAPALLAWLGPPEEHVEACNLCQIGRGSAYSHYYGYLRLMQGPNSVRNRLEKFKRDNPAGLSPGNSAGLSPGELNAFHSNAVVVLTPINGKYTSDWSELRGIGSLRCEVPSFQHHVGGNKRNYGKFSVHEVTGSGGQKLFVALDKVDALGTLRKLRDHDPANFSESNHEKQMRDMMDELEKIVSNSSHLRGQLVVVRYDPEEHVGDAIVAAIERNPPSHRS